MNELPKILSFSYFCLFILLLLSFHRKDSQQEFNSEITALSDSIYNLVYKTALPNHQKVETVEKFKNIVYNNPNDSITRKNLLHISDFYYYLNEIEKSTKTTKKIIVLAKKRR